MLKFIVTALAFFTFSALVSASSPTECTYVLECGQKGADRVEMQKDLLATHTNEQFQKAGLAKGQIVWDIGCGNGNMTLELALRVGETGSVYAIDVSKDQLALATQRVSAVGLKNVFFIQGDIKSSKDLPMMGKADLVFIRSLLLHVSDPKKVIQVAKDLLKPGGVIVSQEPIMSTYYDKPPYKHKIFREYHDAVAGLGKITGNDYDIGRLSKLLFDQAGFSKTEGYFVRPSMDVKKTKKMFVLDINEWTDKAIKLGAVTKDGVLTEGTVANWRRIMNEWPDNDPSQFSIAEFAYVLAWKSISSHL